MTGQEVHSSNTVSDHFDASPIYYSAFAPLRSVVTRRAGLSSECRQREFSQMSPNEAADLPIFLWIAQVHEFSVSLLLEDGKGENTEGS